MKKLVVASKNKGKLIELTRLLDMPEIELVCLDDFSSAPDVEETAKSYRGNAKLKLLSALAHTDLPCFADDSGLEVDALEGAPGIYSARFSGKIANDGKNNYKLMTELSGYTDPAQRKARFRAVIAFAEPSQNQPDAKIHYFEGVSEGHIALEARGKGGFGYDPLFVPEGYTKCMAELEPAEKDKISHRGRACAKLKEFLKEHWLS
ncbi:MAG: RdgB/HAM1 family non-canonical purine NTP pyrophosphatase [Myxococcales bacterium]|nr:MAG: RdgB/HAM1 family non-canonical purine NTP pyrophosphatase [Myxococcales bacterium]